MRIGRVFVGLRVDPRFIPPDCSLAWRRTSVEGAKALLNEGPMVSLCGPDDATALVVLKEQYGIEVPYSDDPQTSILTIPDRMLVVASEAGDFEFRVLSIMQDLSQEGWRFENQPPREVSASWRRGEQGEI